MKLSIKVRRIMYVGIFVCFSIATYAIINMVNVNKSIDVNALPITNKTIVIDAGHGIPDERGCWI
ncbi:hypothetical protein D3C71_1582330 [compost metagenome]